LIRAFTDFLAFMVLFNYIIPVSMYVTVEMQKFLGSYFMMWDDEMFDEELGERAVVNTSDLNEELGQVEYVFTDKTGTLTENNMEFIECCVDGNVYVPHVICNGQEHEELFFRALGFTYLRLKDGQMEILNREDEIERVISGKVEQVKARVEHNAVEGLRTLCVAYRPLSAEQYEQVCHLLTRAKLEFQDQDKLVAEAYDLIERDLILLGATAVEDR
ncbi:hypothetical protein XENOCAPTIV_011501, partial [Xenoophorus captivus]